VLPLQLRWRRWQLATPLLLLLLLLLLHLLLLLLPRMPWLQNFQLACCLPLLLL
jgi:hypothetical protein